MTERNNASAGKNAGEEFGVFVFLPFLLSFLVCRFTGLTANDHLPVCLLAALVLMLLSASSLYGPVCLLLSFALLGGCASAVMPGLSFRLLSEWRARNSVLLFLPLFIGSFCAAWPGLFASKMLRAPGAAFASRRIGGCLKITALQTVILSAGFAASFIVFQFLN